LPWEVRPEDAALALFGTAQVLPELLDTEKAARLTMSCELRIRHGQPVLIRIADGVMRVGPSTAAPVDCHASVDPLKFLLLSFSRISAIGPLLSGGLLVWGRKPWTLKLQSVLNPV
jgi:hypothetical protein